MSKGLSPTQRTLHAQRQLGRVCAIAEKWQLNPRHPAGGYRRDLFGFIDVVSLDPERGIVAIQSCGQSFAAHRRKLLQEECAENVREWLACGGHVELWGWRKVKVKRGGKAERWAPRVEVITLDTFDQAEAA